jgi:hypothetical protein
MYTADPPGHLFPFSHSESTVLHVHYSSSLRVFARLVYLNPLCSLSTLRRCLLSNCLRRAGAATAPSRATNETAGPSARRRAPLKASSSSRRASESRRRRPVQTPPPQWPSDSASQSPSSTLPPSLPSGAVFCTTPTDPAISPAPTLRSSHPQTTRPARSALLDFPRSRPGMTRLRI